MQALTASWSDTTREYTVNSGRSSIALGATVKAPKVFAMLNKYKIND